MKVIDSSGEHQQEDDWFGGFANLDAFNDDEATIEAAPAVSFHSTDLNEIMQRLNNRDPNWSQGQDYKLRTRLVESYMGSMALCRGRRGYELLEAGAIEALIATLNEILSDLPEPKQNAESGSSFGDIIQLARVSWGAIRDLGCGNAEIRARTRQIGGMKLLADYLRRYDGVQWEEIDTIQLRLITSIIGAMRNVTHSARENTVELHQHRVSDLLIWRLVEGSSKPTTNLPDASHPFREACFRAASTLINMAEKSEECARIYASNVLLIHMVVDVTGGVNKKTPVLHLGLLAILQMAKEHLPAKDFDPDWEAILNRERTRKLGAQWREEERKRANLLQCIVADDGV